MEQRVYGFDLNENWQGDNDHYDNQKINGLTFPRTIRSSAFTQKLDIEECDPLALPFSALLYQQANNHWLRKLGISSLQGTYRGSGIVISAAESRSRP